MHLGRPRDRTRLALLALLALAALPAQPRPLPAELLAELPGARLQGQGRLRVLGLRVYEIRLWAPATVARGADWAASPLALEIEYARALLGRLIAERSLQEMRRQASLSDALAARWLAAMTALFPDVNEGDRITGVYRPGDSARFLVNGSFKGDIREPDFARLFFGIWLSPQSSEPALRDALLAGVTK